MKACKSFFMYLLLVLIVGCSKGRSIPQDHGAISALENKAFFEEIGVVKPYNIDSPFAEAVSECIYNIEEENSCSLSKLPLIGMSNHKITVNNILDRTVTSHKSFGKAFEQVLLKLNPEIIQMFGSVNSIVISDKINPSFYYSSSGAIYLSGKYFWSNTDEAEVDISANDPKAAYGTSLQFGKGSDYVSNNKSIYYRSKNNSRTFDEIFLPVVRLLLHELTHANDYFPKSLYKEISALDLTQTYKKISYNRFINSQLLSDNQPTQLRSDVLLHFGKILYQGKPETKEDNLVLAIDIANEFKKDVASDFYSYSSTREDLAMSVEESLMLYYFDVYRYVVVFKYPYSNFIIPEDYDYPIVWGQKSRILVPAIKERVLYAIENVLGHKVRKKVDKKLENLSSVEIPADTSWDDLYDL